MWPRHDTCDVGACMALNRECCSQRHGQSCSHCAAVHYCGSTKHKSSAPEEVAGNGEGARV